MTLLIFVGLQSVSYARAWLSEDNVWTSPCYVGMAEVAMGLLLALLLLLMLFSVPAWPYSAGWGYYPSGGVFLLVIVLAIFFFARPRRTV